MVSVGAQTCGDLPRTCMVAWTLYLGPHSNWYPFTVSFFGEGSPTKIDKRKKGTLILTSLLEDLGISKVAGSIFVLVPHSPPRLPAATTARRGPQHPLVSAGKVTHHGGWEESALPVGLSWMFRPTQ